MCLHFASHIGHCCMFFCFFLFLNPEKNVKITSGSWDCPQGPFADHDCILQVWSLATAGAGGPALLLQPGSIHLGLKLYSLLQDPSSLSHSYECPAARPRQVWNAPCCHCVATSPEHSRETLQEPSTDPLSGSERSLIFSLNAQCWA